MCASQTSKKQMLCKTRQELESVNEEIGSANLAAGEQVSVRKSAVLKKKKKKKRKKKAKRVKSEQSKTKTAEGEPSNQKTGSASRRGVKYRASIKRGLNLVRTSLPPPRPQEHSYEKIVEHSIAYTTELEDCLSYLLANCRKVNGHLIYNSSAFTLTHARSSYVQFLQQADENLSCKAMHSCLAGNVVTTASQFFISLVESCSPNEQGSSLGTPTSSSASGRCRPEDHTSVPTTPISRCRLVKGSSDMENRQEISTVGPAVSPSLPFPDELCTPHQKGHSTSGNSPPSTSGSSPSLPAATRRPRKQKHEDTSTPGMTPEHKYGRTSSITPVATTDDASPAHNTRKVLSPVRKKRLRFEDKPSHSREDKIEQLQVQKLTSNESVCDPLSVHPREKTCSLSLNSEPEVKNYGRSWQIRRLRSTESSDDLPPAKRSLQSPFGVGSSSLSSHLMDGKSSVLLTSKRVDNMTDVCSLTDPSSCGSNSNDDNWKLVGKNLQGFDGLVKCNEGTEAHANKTSPQAWYTSTKQFVRRGVPQRENTEKDSWPLHGSPDVCDTKPSEKYGSPKAYSYDFKTPPRHRLLYNSPSSFLNPLATFRPPDTSGQNSHRKKTSPNTCKVQVHTSPGQVNKCFLLSIPSEALTGLPEFSPSVAMFSDDQTTQDVCSKFKDKHEAKSLEKASSAEFLSSLNVDVNTSPGEEIPCEESEILKELSQIMQGEQTLLHSPTNSCLQMSSSPDEGLPSSKQKSITPLPHDPDFSLLDTLFTSPGNDAVAEEIFTGSHNHPRDIIFEDLQPGTPGREKSMGVQSSYISSPCPSSSRWQQVKTPTQRFRVKEILDSPAGALGPIMLDSFKTPEGAWTLYPLVAPRKLKQVATRSRPLTCRRSLTRDFAERTVNAVALLSTPPCSPMRTVGGPLPEMEFNMEM